MAVAVHYRSRAGTRRRVDQPVHKVYPHALRVHVQSQRQPKVREHTVVVPGHGRHRRDARQAGEHIVSADIAGVEYEVDAPERRQHTGIQVPMCVGNQPDQHRTRPRGGRVAECSGLISPLGAQLTITSCFLWTVEVRSSRGGPLRLAGGGVNAPVAHHFRAGR